MLEAPTPCHKLSDFAQGRDDKKNERSLDGHAHLHFYFFYFLTIRDRRKRDPSRRARIAQRHLTSFRNLD